jgi:hypothetical protein
MAVKYLKCISLSNAGATADGGLRYKAFISNKINDITSIIVDKKYSISFW